MKVGKPVSVFAMLVIPEPDAMFSGQGMTYDPVADEFVNPAVSARRSVLTIKDRLS